MMSGKVLGEEGLGLSFQDYELAAAFSTSELLILFI